MSATSSIPETNERTHFQTVPATDDSVLGELTGLLEGMWIGEWVDVGKGPAGAPLVGRFVGILARTADGELVGLLETLDEVGLLEGAVVGDFVGVIAGEVTLGGFVVVIVGELLRVSPGAYVGGLSGVLGVVEGASLGMAFGVDEGLEVES